MNVLKYIHLRFCFERKLDKSKITEKKDLIKTFKGFGILMTAIFCFVDQRIASLLYFHYSRNLSLYKCCLAKFGCTTIIVIFQILFNRQCFLRKQPIERTNDIELSYPQTDTQQSVLNSQLLTTAQPSLYRKKNKPSMQPSSTINNQTPSFNLRSGMKSTPNNRNTLPLVNRSNRPLNNSDSDINFDAIERHYTVWFCPLKN